MLLFCIPWSHHQKTIDKVNGDGGKACYRFTMVWGYMSLLILVKAHGEQEPSMKSVSGIHRMRIMRDILSQFSG